MQKIIIDESGASAVVRGCEMFYLLRLLRSSANLTCWPCAVQSLCSTASPARPELAEE